MDGLILLSVLLAQGVSGPANTSLQIDASLAFEGFISGREFSELRVRALSRTGGHLVINTIGASPNVSIDIELMPGEAADAWVPLRIGFSDQPLSLSTSLDQAAPRSIPINFVRRPASRLVLVGTDASERLRTLPETESIGSSSLPHIAEAYLQIGALAVDSPAIAALDSDQLRSLLEYVGACGRILLIDVSTAVADIFRNRAACNGRFLKVLGEQENPVIVFNGLIDQEDWLPPSGRQLESLANDARNVSFSLTPLIIFWAGYLFLLVVLLIRPRARFAALAFSVTGTLLVVAIWPAATSSTFVAWAEMTSNESSARYVGLQRYSAARHGTFVLPGDNFGGHSKSYSGGDFSLAFDTVTDQRHILWNAAPFQQFDHLTRGSFPVDTTLQLQSNAGSANVCNTGGSATAPMYVQWAGSLYALPSIAAGASWSTVDRTPLTIGAGLAPELQLFLDRSTGHPLTLLQSLPVPAAAPHDRAWLLQYHHYRQYRASENGGSSCET